MTTYGAIPTMYSGVQFRSRLEARYAAYFDLAGLKWDYEPIDLDGYIPDFLVLDDDCGCGGEGRPGHSCFDLIEVKPALDPKGLLPATGKIDAAGWEHIAWVVGFRPDVALLTGAYIGDPKRWDGPTGYTCVGDRPWPEMWREAGNIVQWKKPR